MGSQVAAELKVAAQLWRTGLARVEVMRAHKGGQGPVAGPEGFPGRHALVSPACASRYCQPINGSTQRSLGPSMSMSTMSFAGGCRTEAERQAGRFLSGVAPFDFGFRPGVRPVVLAALRARRAAARGPAELNPSDRLLGEPFRAGPSCFAASLGKLCLGPAVPRWTPKRDDVQR